MRFKYIQRFVNYSSTIKKKRLLKTKNTTQKPPNALRRTSLLPDSAASYCPLVEPSLIPSISFTLSCWPGLIFHSPGEQKFSEVRQTLPPNICYLSDALHKSPNVWLETRPPRTNTVAPRLLWNRMWPCGQVTECGSMWVSRRGEYNIQASPVEERTNDLPKSILFFLLLATEIPLL